MRTVENEMFEKMHEDFLANFGDKLSEELRAQWEESLEFYQQLDRPHPDPEHAMKLGMEMLRDASRSVGVYSGWWK